MSVGMSSGHPRTPQSPSQAHIVHDLPPKPSTSPRTTNSLPTPAHSTNGSMSSSWNTNTEIKLDVATSNESQNKRKRDVEDSGDREQKKAHIEITRLSIDDLHLDVGPKYLLCKKGKTPFYTPTLPLSGIVSQILFNQAPCNTLQNLVNMEMMRRTPYKPTCPL